MPVKMYDDIETQTQSLDLQFQNLDIEPMGLDLMPIKVAWLEAKNGIEGSTLKSYQRAFDLLPMPVLALVKHKTPRLGVTYYIRRVRTCC